MRHRSPESASDARSYRDAELMRLAIAQARQGEGRTSPNPVVGVVIVRDDTVVAVGHHERAGAPHAEQVALALAGEQAQGAELFVNLEPCCHRGRTQPCTTAILASGVSRVVAGVVDRNPLVSGRGLEALRSAGVDVTCPVLEAECTRLNAPFFKHITTGLPFVTIKYAMTLDGKIATRTGDSRWISNQVSRRRAHTLRDRHDAVLVGAHTLEHDNPRLTTRDIPGGRDPVRVVIDPDGRISLNAAVLGEQSSAPTWVVCREDASLALAERLPEPHKAIGVASEPDGRLAFQALLEELGRRGVVTLLVEGGGETIGSLLHDGHVDRVAAFVAPKLVGGGQAPTPADGTGVAWMSEALALDEVRVERLGDDLLVMGDIRQPKREAS